MLVQYNVTRTRISNVHWIEWAKATQHASTCLANWGLGRCIIASSGFWSCVSFWVLTVNDQLARPTIIVYCIFKQYSTAYMPGWLHWCSGIDINILWDRLDWQDQVLILRRYYSGWQKSKVCKMMSDNTCRTLRSWSLHSCAWESGLQYRVSGDSCLAFLISNHFRSEYVPFLIFISCPLPQYDKLFRLTAVGG